MSVKLKKLIVIEQELNEEQLAIISNSDHASSSLQGKVLEKHSKAQFILEENERLFNALKVLGVEKIETATFQLAN